MAEDDLEVFETEHNSSCATVVMIDISHSMILYGEGPHHSGEESGRWR